MKKIIIEIISPLGSRLRLFEQDMIYDDKDKKFYKQVMQERHVRDFMKAQRKRPP
jgi:hypothetical protein